MSHSITHLSTLQAKPSGRAVGTALKVVPMRLKSSFGFQGLIAAAAAGDVKHDVKLIEVLPSSDVFLFKNEDLYHVWCLIIADDKFTLPSAVDWLKRSKSSNRKAGRKVLPSTAVLARFERFSNDDHHLIAKELRPTGALLCKWAKNAETVEDAFEALRIQMARSYGALSFGVARK
jgi:hypothetical protein